MPYQSVPPEELLLRDLLAKDRTVLANERTLLAYLRTGLMLLVSGVTLYKITPAPSSTTLITASVLGALGGLVAIFGSVRCVRLQRTLNRIKR